MAKDLCSQGFRVQGLGKDEGLGACKLYGLGLVRLSDLVLLRFTQNFLFIRTGQSKVKYLGFFPSYIARTSPHCRVV